MLHQIEEVHELLIKTNQVIKRMENLINTSKDNQLLLSATQAAKCLGISRTLFYEQMNSGRLPPPIRFGKRLVWSVVELNQWIAMGCPSADKWKVIKKKTLP